MRPILSLFLFAALALALRADSQTFSVTPGNLTDWILIGAERSTLARQGDLALPAQAQLTRSFQANAVAVRLTTQPVIGEDPADWPVLELGQAALVLSRNGNTGRLTVVIGNESPQTLPFTFSLDADGRSAEVLTIRFARSDTGVSVALADQSQEISFGPIAGLPLDLVVSAGASQPWVLLGLEGSWAVPDPVTPPSGSGAKAPGGNALLAGLIDSTGGKSSSGPLVSSMGPSAAAAPLPKGAVPAVLVQAGAPGLEIYTPPAIRLGRSAAVRSAVQNQLKN